MSQGVCTCVLIFICSMFITAGKWKQETGLWVGVLVGGICLSPQRGGRGLRVWLTTIWPREWQNQLILNGGVTPALTRVTRHWKENGFWTPSIIAAFLALLAAISVHLAFTPRIIIIVLCVYWNQETGCLFWDNLLLIVSWSGHGQGMQSQILLGRNDL